MLTAASQHAFAEDGTALEQWD